MLGYTLEDYELFIYALQDQYPVIQSSTLTVIRQASNVATIEGTIHFATNIRLHVLEVVRFDVTPPCVTRHGYEVWHDRDKVYS